LLFFDLEAWKGVDAREPVEMPVEFLRAAKRWDPVPKGAEDCGYLPFVGNVILKLVLNSCVESLNS